MLIPGDAMAVVILRGVPMVIRGKPRQAPALETELVHRALETRGPVELQTKFDFKGGGE